MLNGKNKKKIRALVTGILKSFLPFLVIIATFYFLGTVDSSKDDILFKVIKYAIYILDLFAAGIILNIVVGLLYDLDIIKSRRHKVKIKEDD